VATVIFVTMNVGDFMTVTDLDVGDKITMLPIRSPTSQISHQMIWSPTTNRCQRCNLCNIFLRNITSNDTPDTFRKCLIYTRYRLKFVLNTCYHVGTNTMIFELFHISIIQAPYHKSVFSKLTTSVSLSLFFSEKSRKSFLLKMA